MTDLTADYIVIGGGLTGCLVASRLSQSEKEPRRHPARSRGGEFDYAYHSEPVTNTANRVHSLNSGKALGGGSILNYGGWLRADAADYNEWGSLVDDERWGYRGLLSWFRNSENFHDSAADANAHDFDGTMQIVCSNNTATGVDLADGRIIAVRREAIICAGTYRTPQVLSLSGIGPSDSLTQHGISMSMRTQKLAKTSMIILSFTLPSVCVIHPLATLLEAPTAFKGLPWDWVVSLPLPAEIMTKHESQVEKHNRNLHEVLTLYVPPSIPGIPIHGTHIATSTMLLIPTSRCTVSIHSGNPTDPPYIQPNYFSSELDQDSLLHAAHQMLKAMLATAPMKAIVESETPALGKGLDGLTPLTADSNYDTTKERIRRTGMQHHHSGDCSCGLCRKQSTVGKKERGPLLRITSAQEELKFILQ
ncbi:hypothetical protein BKA67DRAFT_651494 [Truncatella angustata]|uniref:Glucose-methanol-choline oxidoreductase N-terminal domain-containing protein n=1 Tax=Truncatella angustata TaxID=152316 RepID=A0A9P8UAN2_9PEZI|nr:uncharacterized protein BKA67DRAFT_651494 [Truncatella angustata]KAH6645017.1 hypothetical protein BKA67DRAFT_651494 [Truncatella angustata]